MAKNRILQLTGEILPVIFILALLAGCASVGGGPQGGPRDLKPPKVLNISPPNLTTNFKEKKIVIQFDEYFKLVEQQKQFSVSPDLDVLPVLKIKNKSLEITIPDTLEKNTTYTLNFGKGIADVNESNTLKNFSYVFSTGPALDSLSISGNIKDATTGLPLIEAVAFVLPLSKDSIFGKKKASIYTLTDSSGNYRINNLRADTYRVYALKEQGSDKIYQQSSDEIGFVKAPLVLTKDTAKIDMQVFKEDAKIFRVNDRRLNPDGSIMIAFNQKLKKPKLLVIEPQNIDADKVVRFSKNKDSVKLWLKDLSFDSTKVSILDDGQLLHTVKFNRGKKDTYVRTVVPTDNIEQNLLNPNKPLQLNFGIPVISADLSKIELMEDSVLRKDFKLVKDSLDLLTYNFSYAWRPDRNYEIKFAPAAFTAIFNATNKEFTKKFQLAKKDDYGTLLVKLIVPEPNKQYVIEISNEAKNIVNSIVVARDTTVKFSNYRAGLYYIRIIYDTNKNGKWDTGNVAMGMQPEKIWNEPKELSIRANWDRNETVTLPKE